MRRVDITQIEVEKSANSYDIHLLGLPFGGHLGGRDTHRKFFTERTYFGIEKGANLPTIYNHGRTDRGRFTIPEFLGKSEYLGIEKNGGWFMSRLDKGKKRARELYEAGLEKALRGSTGLAGTLQRWLPSGEYLIWVPGEISLINKLKGGMVSNELAIGVPVLKAIYEDNGLEWAEVADEQPRITGPTRIVLPKKFKLRIK